jgi:transposase
VAPQGARNIRQLVKIVEDCETVIPEAAQACLNGLIGMLTRLNSQIRELDAEIARRARANEMARRLMTVPGIGPLIATALVALAPPPETFRRGRVFAAWLGLVPRQHSTGGKQRLGATTKMGERSLRRLLIIGANSVVLWRTRKKTGTDPWLARMIERKPALLVRVALANKMARIVWAIMAKREVYRAPVALA